MISPLAPDGLYPGFAPIRRDHSNALSSQVSGLAPDPTDSSDEGTTDGGSDTSIAVDGADGGVDSSTDTADTAITTDSETGVDAPCTAPKITCGTSLCTFGGGTFCTDLGSNPLACGTCGNACATGEVCIAGTCKTGGCTGGTTSCTLFGRTACFNTKTDPNNCGGCGNRCGGDEVCADGVCRPYAPAVGCTTCPCSTTCATILGGGAKSCCPALPGGKEPICVEGTKCPG